MNEQLVVKNFGPIKDATVDFKRVTVFIGPTGGGKSTLAKLAAIFRSRKFLSGRPKNRFELFNNYSIIKYFLPNTALSWENEYGIISSGSDLAFSAPIAIQKASSEVTEKHLSKINPNKEEAEILLNILRKTADVTQDKTSAEELNQLVGSVRSSYPTVIEKLTKFLKDMDSENESFEPIYIPSERVFLSSIEYSWAGLMSENIGLTKPILDFANQFSLSRKDVSHLDIAMFDVQYVHQNGQDFIKIPESETLFRLFETASGIQSVTPLLVLLEHLSRNTEQAQSFIIEEPELNLYPTAQQGLLNWLVEKCTQGENDLTITTHSPYILSHLNLLLYAYQVAEQHPDRRAEVAALVPEASWINPKEFACYQVENGGVQSLVDDDLGLIDNNELDALSGDAADAFDNLIRLSKAIAAK